MPAAALRAVGKAMSKVLALMEIMFYWGGKQTNKQTNI